MSQESKSIELAVVIPVYNEAGAIGEVVKDWADTLRNLGIGFEIHTYNDGSKDNTLELLTQLSHEFSELKVHDKPNSGHGPTILQGYRENAHHPWIFQVDSDNELVAGDFHLLWKERENHDFLIGKRSQWSQPLPRKVISWISRRIIHLFYQTPVWDVNAPYRLMRSEIYAPYFQQIPDDTFAPNLILSGIPGKKKLRVFQTNVVHHQRTTGQVSIKKWKLLKAAFRSFQQSVTFSFNLK
ncbi:glycosyltransferase family 2 protein [bacterium SCSIO 12741]|nr:glycosyltransferase family 2 protein [bacterium SCSIO 12741]